jgi:radical SAM-linked protein
MPVVTPLRTSNLPSLEPAGPAAGRSVAAAPHQAAAEDQSQARPPIVPPLRVRYRIRFAKTGLLRWIGHQDLSRLWERLLRRAGLQLSMTEGFHPKPRMAFASALALGVEGSDEVVEIELAQDLPPAELLRQLQDDDQPGLAIHSVCRLPAQFGKAQLLRSDYVITAPAGHCREAIQRSIAGLLAQPTVTVQRKGQALQVEPSRQIASLRLGDDRLELALAASESASLRPGDVLQLLGLGEWIEQGATITRVRVVLQRELISDDPAVMAVCSACQAALPQRAPGQSPACGGELEEPTP